MKATDLRIGNFVKDYNETVKIESILSSTLKVFCHSLDEEVLSEFNLDQIDPIPLTEEWLLKLGFHIAHSEESYIKYMVGDNFDLLKTPDGTSFYFYWCNDNQVTKLDYVHQLQNLYWCLVGEELKLQ